MNELSSFSSSSGHKHHCKFESICRDQQLRLNIAISEIDKQKQEIFDLKQKLKQKKQNENSVEKIELANAIEHNKILKTKIEILKQQITDFQNNQKQLETRNLELERDNTRLVGIVEKKNAKIAAFKEHYRNSANNEIIDSLKQELEYANKRIDELELNGPRDINNNPILIQNTPQDTEKQERKLNEIINDLKFQLATKQQENERFKQKMIKHKALKNQMKTIQEENNAYKIKIAQFSFQTNEYQNYQQRIEMLQRENDKLKEELENANRNQKQVSDLKIERDALISDTTILEEKVKRLNDLEQSNKELKAKSEELYERLQESAKRETKLATQVNLLMNERSEIINVRKELSMVHNELIEREKREAQNAEQARFYRTENKELRRKIAHLNRVMELQKIPNEQNPKVTETTTTVTKKMRRHHHHHHK